MKINIFLIIVFLFIGLVYCAVRYLLFFRLLRKPFCFLEVTPPQTSDKILLSTKELLIYLHFLAQPYHSFLSIVFPRKNIYALELVATKEKGIRYIIRVPHSDVISVKKGLYAFHPYMQVREVTDYLSEGEKPLWIGIQEISLANHFCYPLKPLVKLRDHDPIAYITGSMTKVKEQEIIAMQILLSPITKQTHRKVVGLLTRLQGCLESEEEITHLTRQKGYLAIFFPLLFFPFTLLVYILTIGNSRLLPFSYLSKKRYSHRLTSAQRDIYQSMYNKTSQQLYETSLRFYVSAHTKPDVIRTLEGLSASLASFSSVYQSFRTKGNLPLTVWLTKTVNLFRMKQRLFPRVSNTILSVDEVSTLYHFPKSAKTEGLQTVKSKQLPPSLDMINETICDFVFAKNNYAGETTDIGLTRQQRRRHMYILGATGTGKTTMLASMIYQDIVRGKGLCVIDPHGDLIEKLLMLIPTERIKDTILFDPSDMEYPIGLNLLELPKGIKDIEKGKDLIASSIVSVFSKLTSGRYWGPRMENILRVSTLTALNTEYPTLFTLQRLLLDSTFRKSVVNTLTDPALLLFWKKEFNQMGLWQRSSMTSPITNKVGRFLTSPLSKYILCQKTSKLDFEEIINSGKILLCNLSKGKLGEDTSALFGGLITAKIQLAALKRASLPEDKRRDFYFYIDEFQNFATPSFAEIMSEARKYRLNAILAHQTIAQIDDHSLTKVILANTGTVISFRASSPVDQKFILPFFAPFVEEADVANLPNFNFYMKVNTPIPQDAFSGETIPMESEENEGVVEKIRRYSRMTYAMRKEMVEKEIQEEFNEE